MASFAATKLALSKFVAVSEITGRVCFKSLMAGFLVGLTRYRISAYDERGSKLQKIIITLIILSGPAYASCEEPEIGTKEVPSFSPPLSEIVIGPRRLQLYSAPDSACAMNGVFVIPKDELVVYAQSRGGWSSVMYSNPGTGNSVSGWVKSSRLKESGTVGPKN